VKVLPTGTFLREGGLRGPKAIRFRQGRAQAQAPRPVVGSTLQGNVHKAKAPGFSLDRLIKDPDGAVAACPCGRKAKTSSEETRDGRKFSAEFRRNTCRNCPEGGICPTKVLKTKALKMDSTVKTSIPHGSHLRAEYLGKGWVDGRWLQA
jgi:hypothetical protein